MFPKICYNRPSIPLFFFFNDTATTEIYTLSLHDALPILDVRARVGLLPAQLLRRHVRDGAAHLLHFRKSLSDRGHVFWLRPLRQSEIQNLQTDRKSTRLNSSHQIISYAVFCLKKKKTEDK